MDKKIKEIIEKLKEEGHSEFYGEMNKEIVYEAVDKLIAEYERLEKENTELRDIGISYSNKIDKQMIAIETLKFEMEKATLLLNKYHEKNYEEYKLQRVVALIEALEYEETVTFGATEILIRECDWKKVEQAIKDSK